MSPIELPSDRWHITRGNLPHKSREGALCFITFRLDDSLPQTVVEAINAEYTSFRRTIPEVSDEEATRRFAIYRHNRLQRYLDDAHGTCLLQRPEVRDIVVKALFYYHDNGQYELHNFVVMPNHVHILLCLDEHQHLQKLIASIKQYTAVCINRLLGRTGKLWQREYFDRLIRNEDHYQRTFRYIYNNPCRLPADAYTYWQR